MSADTPAARARSLAKHFLSRSLSSAGPGAGGLDPALRAALSHRAGSQQQPFAARAALDPDNPQASLDMFRRLSARHRSSAEGGKACERSRRPTAESGAGSPPSHGSLLELLDEGWSGLQQGPGAQQPGQREKPPLPSPASSHGSPPPAPTGYTALPAAVAVPASSAASVDTAFLSAGSTRTLRLASAADDDSQLAAAAAAAALAPGCDTPGSAVSWTSFLSAVTLPQTEAELQALDLCEVEHLAAEAADLQARAALALRLARQRMRVAGSAVPVATTPPARGRRSRGGWAAATAAQLLQCYLLVLVVAEVALSWWAGIVERTSGGVLRLPRRAVLAPVTAAHAAACLVVLLAEAALGMLQRAPGAALFA